MFSTEDFPICSYNFYISIDSHNWCVIVLLIFMNSLKIFIIAAWEASKFNIQVPLRDNFYWLLFSPYACILLSWLSMLFIFSCKLWNYFVANLDSDSSSSQGWLLFLFVCFVCLVTCKDQFCSISLSQCVSIDVCSGFSFISSLTP